MTEEPKVPCKRPRLSGSAEGSPPTPVGRAVELLKTFQALVVSAVALLAFVVGLWWTRGAWPPSSGPGCPKLFSPPSI